MENSMKVPQKITNISTMRLGYVQEGDKISIYEDIKALQCSFIPGKT